MRCFTAIDLNEEARESLAGVLADLRHTGAELKLVERHNLHVTLVFLGEVPDTLVPHHLESLRRLRFAPFELELRGVGFFPSRSRIHTVWAGCGKGSERVVGLEHQLQQLLGVQEHRPFTPHVALARVKAHHRLDALRALADRRAHELFARLPVREVKFRRSTLTPQGPVYEDLAVLPLREA